MTLKCSTSRRRCSNTTNTNSTLNLTVGTVDEIDPRLGNPNGPVVINSFPMPNCMPSGIVQGPGNQFLVGCGDHDGETFPVNEYIIDGTTGKILVTIDQVGGVDEVWYNPTDNRYYLAARDMPTGPQMGVIDAFSNRRYSTNRFTSPPTAGRSAWWRQESGAA